MQAPQAAIDWGSVPDWFAAIGTVGALVVALLLLGKELKDRRRAAALADLQPASQVFAWAKPEKARKGWATYVLNGSNEPIYDVIVRFTPRIDRSGAQTVERLWGTVAPGRPEKGDWYPNDPREVFGFPRVEIEFTDGRGRHWVRDPDGHLEQRDFRMPFD